MPDPFRHPLFRKSKARGACGTVDAGTIPAYGGGNFNILLIVIFTLRLMLGGGIT